MMTACEGSVLACVLRDIVTAIEQQGDPWPQFWLTMIATFTGAIIGSVAAWLFALDLRARDERARRKESTDAAVAPIIGTLIRYANTMGSGSLAVGSPNAYYDELELQFLVARISADRDDLLLISLMEEAALQNPARQGGSALWEASALLDIAKVATNWRQGLVSRDQAERSLRALLAQPW
jgi:hypothetical protein